MSGVTPFSCQKFCGSSTSCSKDRGSLLAAGPVRCCEGSGSHRSQGHMGFLSLPREPFRVFRYHLTLCPQHGAPGHLAISHCHLPPQGGQTPPTRARPHGKLAIAVRLSTDASLTLNVFSAYLQTQVFSSLPPSYRFRRRGRGGPGSSGAAFSESCQPAPVPCGHPGCSRTRLCAQRGLGCILTHFLAEQPSKPSRLF